MQNLTIKTVLLSIYAFSVVADDAFNALDVNKDNVISKEEAVTLPGLVSRWEELDINLDDQLSSTEFQAYADPADMAFTPDIEFHIQN